MSYAPLITETEAKVLQSIVDLCDDSFDSSVDVGRISCKAYIPFYKCFSIVGSLEKQGYVRHDEFDKYWITDRGEFALDKVMNH